MKLLKRLIVVLLLVLIIGSVVAVFQIVEDRPSTAGSLNLTTDDLRQARVFIDNTDPRELEPGSVNAFKVSERDLELVLGYGLSQMQGGGASVDLNDGLATLEISARLPENILGEYLNVNLVVSQVGQNLAVESLRLGGLGIPGAFADSVLQFTHSQLTERVPEYVAVLDAINGYSISPGQLNIVYQWQPDLLRQISDRSRSMLLSEEDQQRLISHASNLAAVTNNSRLGREVSLAEILGPMMLFAKVRGGDPVEENRAAIIAMSMYIMGISMPRVLGLPEDSVPVSNNRKLTLSDRHDFAQHFLVSAGLTVSSGTGIADAIGLLKELEDSQGGSGFSFTDLGADRSGVRFAELAVSSRESAQALQDKMSYQVLETDFMAEFRDLPEFMDESTFLNLYGEVGSTRYNAVLEDIENRISNTRIFRELDR